MFHFKVAPATMAEKIWDQQRQNGIETTLENALEIWRPA